MKYYVKETVFDEVRNRTAATKARGDINTIAEQMGFEPIEVNYDYGLRKRKGLFVALKALTNEWRKAMRTLQRGDIMLVQYPINHHPLRIAKMIDDAHRRDAQIILLIHDIDTLRMPKRGLVGRLKYAKIHAEDMSTLKRGDAIIAHNNRMVATLKELGIQKEAIPLQLFDYVCDSEDALQQRSLGDPVVIAGTLRKGKAGYVYDLPQNTRFNLYGVGYEDDSKENIEYFGSFEPNELLGKMHGSFGLVWDGNSSTSCEGLPGKYLRVNNPHKTSLYLAAGLPVVVWGEAAIADFIHANECGITVSSLYELNERLDGVEEDDYLRMCANAAKISKDVRRGEYAKRALSSALQSLA